MAILTSVLAYLASKMQSCVGKEGKH